jgi:hypothetical protein
MLLAPMAKVVVGDMYGGDSGISVAELFIVEGD